MLVAGLEQPAPASSAPIVTTRKIFRFMVFSTAWAIVREPAAPKPQARAGVASVVLAKEPCQ